MLIVATKLDITYLHRLYMHPSINPYLLYEQMEIEEFTEAISPLIDQGIIYLYRNQNGQDVGMVKLYRHTHRSYHIFYLGGFAVDPDHTGHGYGKEILRACIDHAWAKGGARVELSVWVGNDKAIYQYKSVGFKEEGILRNYTYLASENRYLDEMMMSVLK
jgi:L-phenylalanine/L-methionine N-acetyltransferase